jgi:hypothetical protein
MGPCAAHVWIMSVMRMGRLEDVRGADVTSNDHGHRGGVFHMLKSSIIDTQMMSSSPNTN